MIVNPKLFLALFHRRRSIVFDYTICFIPPSLIKDFTPLIPMENVQKTTVEIQKRKEQQFIDSIF